MEPTLPPQHQYEIKEALSSGTFAYASEMQKLMDAGYDQQSAHNLLLSLAKEHRKEIFQQTLNKQNNQDVRQVTWVVIFMVAVLGPVFDINSGVWYMLAMLVAGVAGYYGHKDKPLVGIIGSVLFVFLFPLTYRYYFSGRSSYLRIELVIPAFLAIIPSVIAGFLISVIFYPSRKN